MIIKEVKDKKDLHLTFLRGRSSQWELKASAGEYVQTVVAYKIEYGNLYLQGTCVNNAGKELSVQEVGKLIDANGLEAINLLDGSFAIAVDDKRHGVWCATDCSATFPLFYKLTPDELTITSLPGNMRIANSNDLDIDGIIASLNSGYPWGELTLLKSWKALRPGHMISINQQNGVSVKSYFNPEDDESVRGYDSPEELLREIDAELISIADRYRRILVPLSGGVDSRLIAVRCHKLGIPFEAITFVANVKDGDDFDVASKVAKILGVRHHRWEWSPSKDCVRNFKQLCIATGGTNDAFTSYPDGMGFFGQVASEFDCALRGDHVFGWGEHVDSLYKSACKLGINYKDNLKWALNAAYQDSMDIESIFEQQEGVSTKSNGEEINLWRNRSYRMSRSPRFIMPMGQLQARHTIIAYPLQTKGLIQRICRTGLSRRDDKVIVREALSLGSPPEIDRIPIATQPTWQGGEPLLNLPGEIIREMIDIVCVPSILSEVVSEKNVSDRYMSYLDGRGHYKVKGKEGIKRLIKKIIPKPVLEIYQQSKGYHRVAQYMVFKRYFAMKVYIDSIS